MKIASVRVVVTLSLLVSASAQASKKLFVGGLSWNTSSAELERYVGSKVKEVVREAGLRSDGELVQALSDKVHEILRGAIHRAKSNKRGTVRPYDL